MTEISQGLILGAVQGIAEWLPISSEGINTLILVHFFGESSEKAVSFAIWLHTGTVLAAIVYFRTDLVTVISRFPRYLRHPRERKGSDLDPVITFLIVATALAGIIGGPLLLFGLDDAAFPGEALMAVVGCLLIVTAFVQRAARGRSGTRTTPRFRDSVVLGVVQALSVLPGLSRSGLTVSALLMRGYEGRQAIRLSFLMSIPLIVCAEVGLALTHKIDLDASASISIVPAFALGLLTIGALIRIARRVAFCQLCLLLGLLSFVPLVVDALQ